MKQIVILAGGLATRLYPITKTIPKSMVLIKGKPFFEYQIELCKKNGISEIVMCVGHLREQIEDYYGDGKKFGLKIKYSVEKEGLDTGGALKNAFPYLDKEFFVMYGDSYLTNDWQKISQSHKEIGTKGLMTVYKNNWKIEPSKILLDKSKKIIQEFNKEKPRSEMKFTEYGLNILPKEIIRKIKEKKFPISRYFDLLIKEKQLAAFISQKRFYEVGSFKGIEALEEFI